MDSGISTCSTTTDTYLVFHADIDLSSTSASVSWGSSATKFLCVIQGKEHRSHVGGWRLLHLLGEVLAWAWASPPEVKGRRKRRGIACFKHSDASSPTSNPFQGSPFQDEEPKTHLKPEAVKFARDVTCSRWDLHLAKAFLGIVGSHASTQTFCSRNAIRIKKNWFWKRDSGYALHCIHPVSVCCLFCSPLAANAEGWRCLTT